MKLLTIDTSTSCCSVALTNGEELVSDYLVNQGKTLSSRLLDCVDLMLRGAGLAVDELDGFGVALGPGAFTGLRVGIATVKGLALAAGKPVAGFSSLAMLAMNLPWAAHPVCPMFDARKKEVYAGLYDCRDLPVPLAGDRVVAPDRLLETLDGPVIFVGEGAVRYRELIVARLGENALFAPCSANLPRASAGALLAGRAFARGEAASAALLAPVYIRPSEAELARMNRETP
ncbi:MAG: tRNA (adenosine(37)-N6)-threonylcarbamoyltransferase complex dimerization subunit type 1 TsaB [Geobacteraceae bacterium]|nr:tRNA (adenosine(37)-N6)-threonylcarbamoyltransferase complex dimerization subunit type 1 TsaB [Geobacteraceae bacterium]